MASITVPDERVIAEVKAYPDEVGVKVHAPDGLLTAEQARHLARLLTEAADESLLIDWLEKPDGRLELVPRESE